ncbi:hypothetical protein [Nocardioides sp. 503]|uniref:hypothetical protein n=1 Tax=Nocardioides sp. 503 TaxID=2508326 RepID=UPI001431DCAD|nr:hypothetical protein [Nocardioides sp. 503]
MSAWFERDPQGVEICPLCGCPVQRTASGTLADGMTAHRKVVHADEQVPQLTGASS